MTQTHENAPHWAFIDLENSPHLDDIPFKQYQRIFIFVGPKQPHIKLPSTVPSPLCLDIIRVTQVSHNNVDFHLAWYLGWAHQQVDISVPFSVYSKDNGFAPLIAYITQKGRMCHQLPGISAGKSQASDSSMTLQETLQILKAPFFRRNTGFPKQLIGLHHCIQNVLRSNDRNNIEGHVKNLLVLKVISLKDNTLIWHTKKLASLTQ